MNTHLCVNTGTHFCINFTFNLGGRRGRDRMVVGFTTNKTHTSVQQSKHGIACQQC
jgi:hypothetical protein